MCGIIGITGKNISAYNKETLDAMLGKLSKRGPDDCGTVLFPTCLLGQTRLSIIDLTSGHQPMSDNKRDMAITFNGEIYNYRELKKDLETKGYIFSTNSDTEVIIKAYQEYGDECPKYLDGMFAFAIWDNEKKRLFMARDRFGEKPLYYVFDDKKNLLIASEIKALFESRQIKGKIDYEAIDNYLTLMYIPPWKTVYKNINVIPPASFSVFENNNLQIKKYWQLEKMGAPTTYTEAKEEVRRLLTESVEKRMIADVEIGSFLSGGVDSTLITAIAQSFSETPIKTFSVGYQDYINELPFAAEAAQKIGTDHHTLQAKDDMVQELETAIEYFDEPHADSSDFPQYILSKFTAQKVKVALSGDGADELFLGYGWYTRHKNLSYRAHFKEKVFMNPFDGYLNAVQVFTPKERAVLWKNHGYVNGDFINDEMINSKLSSAEKINLFDLTTYLPGQLLVKSDRMGMMNSLEVRSPFLDYHLAEFVYRLPDDYKTNTTMFKRILKDILGEIMPQEFVHRRKQGFGAPVKKWLRKETFKKEVCEKLYNSNADIYSVMDEQFVKTMIDNFYLTGNDQYNYKIWVLYCLELWFNSHKQYFAP
ncbi:MAG: asparagine synthase (glutamine-hydrolysing) [Parcubacteria group bacterium Athens0714_16]|nr:MAG: asparagine synthase (glutamine-hydrolysing) [Parcubacteria group bacterium Athens0714_16]